ncbi:CST complex subunit Ten1 [Phaeosphaeriaceae sp. PMI808]|nr:CST complex subunit Ten1 [Phaeosphaeriaceae sp. PMI808]
MSNGPVPSNLVLLSDLTKSAPGTKVRFLGCVDDYVVKTATLLLKHHDSTRNASPVIANVNIEHVLEQIKRHELDVGTWINVIGYVQQRKEQCVFVQAVAVWDAGQIDQDAYLKAVEKRKEVG